MLLSASAVGAQTDAGGGYADEDRDWGVAPTERLRQPPYHAPTPHEIPGARVVRTPQLLAMLAGKPAPILIDVLAEEAHTTLAGALWLPGLGRGASFVDPLQAMAVELLRQVSGGDHSRALVFLCAGPQCWLSYNAALRAAAAGYSEVYWYRGGIEAWSAAQLPLAPAGR